VKAEEPAKNPAPTPPTQVPPPITETPQLEKEKRLVALFKAGTVKENHTPQARAEIATLLGELSAEAVGEKQGRAAKDAQQAVLMAIIQRHDPQFFAEIQARMKVFLCRSKQGEAKVALRAGYLAQWTHKREGGAFTSALQDLGDLGTLERYGVQVVEADETHFILRAVGKGDMQGDVMEITDKGLVLNVKNLCPLPQEPTSEPPPRH
jgi:acyl-CoA-binding protein